jgi:hypothetical protein
MAKAQGDLVYAAFMLLALYLYLLSSLDIQRLSNYAEHKIEAIGKITAMHFSLLGATLIFNHIWSYKKRCTWHWAFIVAYIGAGIYTTARFLSDMQVAETHGGYTLLLAAYSAPVLFFTSSTYRPERPGL